MEDNRQVKVDIDASDNNYELVIERVIKKNRELEEQLNKTTDAVKRNNESFNDIENSLGRYNSNFKLPPNRSNSYTRGNNSTNDIGKVIDMFNSLGGRGANKTTKLLHNINNLYSSIGKNSSINMGAEVHKSAKNSALKSELLTKQFKAMGEGTEAASVGAAKLSSGATKLGANCAKVALPVAIVVASLGLMTIAGKQAAESNAKVANGLRELGNIPSKFSDDAVKASRDLISLEQEWQSTKLSLEQLFTPIYAGMLKVGVGLGKLLNINPENKSKDDAPSNLRIPLVGSMSSDIKQSGFSQNSANNLANGTYSLAVELQKKTGDNALDIAKKLEDAWLKGSDAAKKYGVVVDDDTLKGWLAKEKGIDAVNVKLSEARMQAYRFELASLQASKNTNGGIQSQIKGWKEYGSLIEHTKNILFDFDEAIVISGFNPEIPEIGPKGKNEDDPTVASIDKGIAPTGKPNGGTPIKPQSISVIPKMDAKALDSVKKSLNSLKPKTVPVAVRVQNENVLDKLKKKLGSFKPSYWTIFALQVMGYPALGMSKKLIDSIKPQYNPVVAIKTTGMESLVKAKGLIEDLEKTATRVFASIKNGVPTVIDALKSVALEASGLGAISRGAGVLNRGIHAVNDWMENSKPGKFLGKASDWLVSPDMQKKVGKAGLIGVGGALTGGAGVPLLVKGSEYLGQLSRMPIMGHADGGLSVKEHIARFSEGNRPEVNIPLSSSKANPAYEQIGKAVASHVGNSANIEIHNHIGEKGTIIASEYSVNQFADKIGNKLTQQLRNRGALNYGVRG